MNYLLTQDINNQTEHLRIINENLQVVNEELEKVLLQKDSALLQLEKSNIELQEKRELINELIEKGKFIISDMDNEAKINLKKSKEILEQAKLDSEEIVKDAKNEKEELIKDRTNLIKELNELTDKKVDREEQVVSLINKIILLQEEVDAKEKVRSTLSKSIFNQKKELETLLKDIKDKELYLVSELSKVEKRLEEERDKISNPAENLRKASLELAKKERNITILENRLKNKFKKVFPDQQIII